MIRFANVIIHVVTSWSPALRHNSRDLLSRNWWMRFDIESFIPLYSDLNFISRVSKFWKIPKARRRGFVLELISTHLLYWNCTELYKFIIRGNIYLASISRVSISTEHCKYLLRKRILFYLNISKFLIYPILELTN